jgi:nitrate/TMAO reductase-like tetraheme cytochrome c subunit
MMRQLRVLFRLLSANRHCVVGAALAAFGCVALHLTFLVIALRPTVTPVVGVLMPLVLPMVVVAGVALLALGLARHTRKLAGDAAAEGKLSLGERVDLIKKELGVERRSAVIVPLAAAGVVVAVLLSTGGLKMAHHATTPSFCGQACHAAMAPEWIAYQDSPHAGVPCVKCHVGKGIGGWIEAKRAGVHDLICILTGLYDLPAGRPAPAMPPWRETCGSCHWLGRDYADKLVVRRRFLDDRESTPVFSVVNLKVGSDRPGRAHGIHWHASTDTKVEYKSARDEREKILWVRRSRADGTLEEFFLDDAYDDTSDLAAEGARGLLIRRMDCYDCHNRAAHRFRTLDEALDLAIESDRLPRSLAFVKARARKALGAEYESVAEMESAVENAIMDFYRSREAEAFAEMRPEVERTVEALKAIHARNVHPDMNVTWDTYPGLAGHRGRMEGCFRCHNQRMRTRDGRNISQKCSLCHDMLADGEMSPEVVKGLSP